MDDASERPAVPMLRINGLVKTFAGTQALRGVDLEIRPGEIHAFVGANGSGKSTTIKTLAGFHAADPGAEASFDGEPLDLGSTAADRHPRLRFVHQDLGLIAELSAADNMALKHGYVRGRLGQILWREQDQRTREALARFGTEIDIHAPLASASAVVRTEVAIAAALQGWEGGRGLLVLDEPTAMLPPGEVARLFQIVRDVRAQGASVLYVSHRLDEVFELADRVSVIRAGVIVATRDIDDITSNELTTLMVGSEGSTTRHVENVVPTDEVVMTARNLTGHTLRGVSFDVHRGEVLGIAGLIGSGSEELPYVVAGMRGAVAGGEVRVAGERPAEGDVPLVPADRVHEGVFGELSVLENLTISILPRLTSRGRLRHSRERATAAHWIGHLGVETAGPDAAISTLSGGNQQKVVMARCLAAEPTVLAMCEPTAGVDIGTRTRIYDIVADEARRGLSVVVTSSDPGDLIAMCTRVLVVRDGLLVRELVGEEITEASIVHATEGTEAS